MSSVLTSAVRNSLKQTLGSNPVGFVSRRSNSTQTESAFKRFLRRPVRMDEAVFVTGVLIGGVYSAIHTTESRIQHEWEQGMTRTDEALCLSERIQQLELLKIGEITQDEYVEWLKKNIEKRKKLAEGFKRVELNSK